ncbi:AAA family ATPase [Bacillus subtilis]|nr:AAA family ATPase [Bacillus subtilis]MDM5301886.1 AAA family ATPase [Bacillus subtilis]MDM5323939.1 AAA family ATPase [Bacillus subtilis]
MEAKIVIYFGPTREFIKGIEETNLIQLRTLVNWIDKGIDKEEKNIFDNKKDLVCFSEGYAAITEGFLGELPIILKQLVDYGYLQHCYIQNPPNFFLTGLKRVFNEDEIEIKQHEFEHVKKSQIKDLFINYKDKILGQDEAIKNAISTIYPLTSKKHESPIVIMFYGPAGVGKTETGNFLSECLFAGKLFRKQLSMIQAGESVQYFLGDSINKNSFGRDLLERESNVILLDEFDKCNSIIYSAFYQMFDEGVYVDKNYTVNLKNTIIICTSNFESRQQMLSYLGEPIYSRFNGFIKFNPLSTEMKSQLISRIYEQQLKLWDEDEIKIIEESNLLYTLKEQAHKFSNVRNIRNEMKTLMSRKICEDFFEEL